MRCAARLNIDLDLGHFLNYALHGQECERATWQKFIAHLGSFCVPVCSTSSSKTKSAPELLLPSHTTQKFAGFRVWTWSIRRLGPGVSVRVLECPECSRNGTPRPIS